MSPDEARDEAKLEVLGESIDPPPVKEEQDARFPKLRRRMDIKAVGAALQARQESLMADGDALH